MERLNVSQNEASVYIFPGLFYDEHLEKLLNKGLNGFPPVNRGCIGLLQKLGFDSNPTGGFCKCTTNGAGGEVLNGVCKYTNLSFYGWRLVEFTGPFD